MLRQCATTAITAVRAASIMFAMLGRLLAQLKMPRLDAYLAPARELLCERVELARARPLDVPRFDNAGTKVLLDGSRDAPVRRAISRMDRCSRSAQGLMTLSVATSITPSLPAT